MHLHVTRLRVACSAMLSLSASPLLAQTDTLVRQDSGVLVSAVNWLHGTLLGMVATVVSGHCGCGGRLHDAGRTNWR